MADNIFESLFGDSLDLNKHTRCSRRDGLGAPYNLYFFFEVYLLKEASFLPDLGKAHFGKLELKVLQL